MITVSAKTAGECWKKCIYNVLELGQTDNDEDIAIREILGLSLEISHPSPTDSFIYEMGDQKVISRMLEKFSKGITMDDRPFTYGQLIYDMNGVDQFEWLVERLKKKPETKSACISLMVPGLSASNLPCLSALDAKIRGEALHLQFFFRSQNIFGRQYANLLALADFHEKLAQRIGCGVGTMKGYIASAHIYEYDIESAQKFIEIGTTQIADNYYSKGPASVRI